MPKKKSDYPPDDPTVSSVHGPSFVLANYPPSGPDPLLILSAEHSWKTRGLKRENSSQVILTKSSMSHPILVEGPYPDSPTKESQNYSASVLGSLLDDIRNQLSRPPGSIWLQPKNDPQNFPLESSRFTPG